MRRYKDRPDEGELVVVAINEIHEHSAEAKLEEYDTYGMIHISEVSRSWVRDIRSHLDEGQKAVAQVVDVEDGSINLSLKRVNDTQQREKMEEWNKEEKADKFLQKVADQADTDVDALYEAVAFPFQREYGTTFEGFERAAMDEVDFDDLGIDDDIAEAVTSVAKENISLKNVELEGELTIEVPGGGGIDVIKDALEIGDGAEISYVSAPTYEITVWGRNTDDAKRKMDEATDQIRAHIEDHGGTFAFEKR